MGSRRPASETAARLGGEIDEALADVDVPAFILDRGGVIQWLNGRAEEVAGDVRGRHFSSVVSPEDVNQARVEFTKQMLGNARRSNRDLVLRDREGKRFEVELHTVALGDGRSVVGVFGILNVREQSARRPTPDRSLTPRQHEVLVQLAHGASTEQIAASLGVALETVRNHVRGVLRSLGAHSRLEAVAKARSRGLI